MKYKLINKQTNEETLCDKVIIDRFIYFIKENKENEDLEGSFCYFPAVDKIRIAENGWYYTDCHKVIATNNPNIDIPKIIDDEVQELALKITLQPKVLFGELKKCSQNDALLIDEFGDYNIVRYRETTGFILGYKKSQETHPFTEEDMIDFADWEASSQEAADFWRKNRINLKMEGSGNRHKELLKELLQIWKEQKIKTIYYE